MFRDVVPNVQDKALNAAGKSFPFLLGPSNLPAWTKQEVRVCVVHMTEQQVIYV